MPAIQQMLLGTGAAGGGGGGAEATAFLARTTGLDATHTNAYIDLIDGLVADSIWSKLDILYIFATQDGTTALLNLVGTSYPAISNGSPTFTADLGFTGVNLSGSVWINTAFNPSTASSPQYTQNSAHISAWTSSSSNSDEKIMGVVESGAESIIIPRNSSNNAVLRVNVGAGLPGQTVASAFGYSLVTRTSSTSVLGYKDGVNLFTNNAAASGAIALDIKILGVNHYNGNFYGSPYRCAGVSIGSSLSAGDVTAITSRLRTYMTAVGVP